MIPKLIHLCWLSGDEYPDLIQKCVASWKTNLPDYEVMIWDTKRVDLSQLQWVREAFELRKYAFAADYIRLHALYTHGGIYLDADVEVLKNLDQFLKHTSFIGFEMSGDFEPAVIGAEPGVPWIGECLEYYRGRPFVRADGSLDMRPLPLIVGDVLNKTYDLGGEGERKDIVNKADITVYPASYFSPKSHHTGAVAIEPGTYTIHHFDGQWVEKGLVYGFKQRLHSSLYKLLGARNHTRFIKFVRQLRT